MLYMLTENADLDEPVGPVPRKKFVFYFFIFLILICTDLKKRMGSEVHKVELDFFKELYIWTLDPSKIQNFNLNIE